MNELEHVPASLLAMLDVPLRGIVIKSMIAMALAALACQFLGRQSAALRHRIWVLGLAASLVVPMVSWLSPPFAIPVLPSPPEASGPVTTRDLGAGSAGGSTARSVIPGPESDKASIAASPADAPQAVRKSEELPPPFAGTPGVEQAFALCWLLGTMIGSALFLIPLARQSIWLSRLRKIDDDDWGDSVAAAARAIGLQRPIVALESDIACVPAVVGVLRPRLVVPSNWRAWSPAQRHCILLHELAHIQRCDVATQWLGRLALLAYWFNPLVWHAVGRLRAERELASDDCVLLAGQRASDYAEQLLRTLRCYRPVRPEMGVAMAHSARLDQRVLAILDPQRRRNPVGSRLAILLPCAAGLLCGVLGGVTLGTRAAIANPPPKSEIAGTAKSVKSVWKENDAVEYPGALPVSVAFSADGKTLLTGDTAGEVMALVFADGEPRWRWKSKVEGAHAAVAFSADQRKVYATTEHGVRILDAALGKEEARIEERDSNPTAIGVFPQKTIAENFTSTQIVFGAPRGYFVKSWAEGKPADTLGTIETSTVAKDAKPADETAVPLAVDPEGRSAIMTGPIDATGDVGGVKGKNVLWAYVCGDYEKGSPGNRVMAGHTAAVASAAWAREGGTAVTGDAAGRVIVWDAKTMKEARRLELGGRVAALAISDDGTRTAAYVLGRQGEVFVWETENPIEAMKPIHTELGDFGGPQVYASLSFSPDGGRLAGCAIDKTWLNRLGELAGKVRLWELSAEPRAQLPPKRLYVKPLRKGSSKNFVILDNHSILMPAAEQGAVDFVRIADGGLQARIVLGEFSISGMKLSTDRQWLAMEQRPLPRPRQFGGFDFRFEIGVYDSTLVHRATIPSCSELLDIAPGGKVVAVVREEQIELWDTATTTKLKGAPFKPIRIDAACFSPDGQLLAISDRNELVLWRWEDGTHERIDLGRSVGSLAFSPDGKFLAEGPAPRENIQIRDVETRKVVQTLANGAKRSMDVPRMAYSQGGRVLIAGDASLFAKEIAVPYRINLWDMADGSLVHELTVPAGLPQTLDVSPNGRFLVATLEEGDGVMLSAWRLDDENPMKGPGLPPPASARPQ